MQSGMDSRWLSIMAASLFVAALVGGVLLGQSFKAETLAQVAAIESRALQVQSAVQLALEVPSERERLRQNYWSLLAQDAKDFGVSNPNKNQWSQAARYRKWNKKSKVLKPKQRWKAGPLQLRVKVDKVAFMRGGAKLKSRHTILVLRNQSKQPVAYRLVARSHRKGKCEVRGTRRHNALVLGPGEKADLTICAGKVAVNVVELQTTVLHPLSYRYLNQLPPQIFALDTTTSAAHRPTSHTRVCTHLPAGKMSRGVKAGGLGWKDIVDFYRRHNCARYEMPMDYRARRSKLKDLPVPSGADVAS